MQHSDFTPGDAVRIQLSPDGDAFRYAFNRSTKTWSDTGYGGEWVDATIMSINSNHYLVGMMYQLLDGSDAHFNFPCEGNEDYEGSPVGQQGYPNRPTPYTVPVCGCGCDSNVDHGTHYDWCPKRQYLESRGLF